MFKYVVYVSLLDFLKMIYLEEYSLACSVFFHDFQSLKLFSINTVFIFMLDNLQILLSGLFSKLS